MIKVYTRENCPQCKVLKMKLKQNNVDYTEIQDDNKIGDIATKSGIKTLPISEINGEIKSFKDMIEYLKAGGK